MTIEQELPSVITCATPKQFAAAIAQIEGMGGQFVTGGGGIPADTPNGQYDAVVTGSSEIARAANDGPGGVPRYYCRSMAKVDLPSGETEAMVLHGRDAYYKAGQPVECIVKDSTGRRKADYPKSISYKS